MEDQPAARSAHDKQIVRADHGGGRRDLETAQVRQCPIFHTAWRNPREFTRTKHWWKNEGKVTVT